MMQLEILTFSKAAAGGISGKPPRRRVQTNAAAITRETASLTPCLRQKPWAGLGWRVAWIAMSSPDNTNGHPALRRRCTWRRDRDEDRAAPHRGQLMLILAL